MPLTSVDETRVVLNSCNDYRPSARGYINASFVEVKIYISTVNHVNFLCWFMWSLGRKPFGVFETTFPVWPFRNADWMQTSSTESISRFIATQGPLPHTFEDFWEMVIQYHCPVIVMLTRLVDNYKVLHNLKFKVTLVVSMNHVLLKSLILITNSASDNFEEFFLRFRPSIFTS